MKLDQTVIKPGSPTILVIFGATGDLMVKKIAPALYQLFLDEKLPKMFSIIGSSRRELTDEGFRDHIRKILSTDNSSKEKVNEFLTRIYFHQAEFSDQKDYQSLARKLGKIDGEWKTCANKLFYLAIPPTSYELLFKQLAESGMTKPCSEEEGWTRIIVEKPFGDDYNSAQKLDSLLSNLYQEKQIYRIDHYLAKEMLQNILVFRFTNNLFEKLWNKEGIKSIDVLLDEDLGVEKRGAFYEKVGALRDVGQNHMLQILALMMMDNPLSFNAKSVREKRAQLLSSLPILTKNEIKEKTKRAQYEGYQDIEGVSANSKTETYFKITFTLPHPRWEGVPITIYGGKKTGRTKKEIKITFQHPSPCLCPIGGEHLENKVVVRFDDKEEIAITLWAKKSGLEFEIEERKLSLLYEKQNKKAQYTSEYQKLLLDCINGNQVLFVSSDEITAMWKFIDPIIEAWQNNEVPLEKYEPNTLPLEKA